MAAHDSVDLLIIGGGINGAGIARDAAGRGLTVALIEQADLASGTSGASTKLIHGGLRYLETFDFRLVREALAERERLLAIAPHIMRPMRFVVPHVPGLRPRWMIRTGLFLYDHLGGRRHLPASHALRLAGTPRGAGMKTAIRHGFEYSDCWVDDSRLVVLNALDASLRGASIHTRTELISAAPVDGQWQAMCHDRVADRQFVLQARALVNAAGPWVDDILHRLDTHARHARVQLVKGSHIVVPRLYPGEHAFLLQNRDRRVVFAIPYERDYTLIGTTDVAYEGNPADARISEEETAYLCEVANDYFERSIAPCDVKWTYAGVRPLNDDESANPSKASRDYTLELRSTRGAPPLLSVLGGKLTTYRRLAEAALQHLHPYIGGTTRSWTAATPLPGGDLPRADFAPFLADVRTRWGFLPDAWAERLARSYGTRIELILGNARCIDDLGEHYGAGLTAAELQYLQEHEWAASAEDILWRRTKLGLHMSDSERRRCEEAMS